MEIALLTAAAVILIVIIAGYIGRLEEKTRSESLQQEQELDEFLVGSLCAILDEHEEALLSELRRRLYRDPYGNWIREKAEKELMYFLHHVVLPAMPQMNSTEEQTIALLVYKWWRGIDLDELSAKPMAAAVQSDGVAYERQIAATLAQAGFGVTFTPVTGDQGVDIIATRDGFRAAIQCKNYLSAVGNDAVQQVFAGGRFYEASHHVVVAPNGFTTAALQLANSLGVKCVHHDTLADTLKRADNAQDASAA